MKSRFSLKKIFPLFLFLLLIFNKPSMAQTSIGVGLGNAYLQPVGSLHDWFSGSFNAPRLEFIFNRQPSGLWHIFATAIHFDQPNKDKLFYKDLHLDLKLYGLGVGYLSFLSRPVWGLQPFGQAEVTLFRWQALRGIYQLEERLVPERFQQGWSFAGSLGAGLLVHLTSNLKISTSINYQLVVAELWPALALHLENVSGLQMAGLHLKLQWWF